MPWLQLLGSTIGGFCMGLSLGLADATPRWAQRGLWRLERRYLHYAHFWALASLGWFYWAYRMVP
jgi:hypothetical protein